MSNKTVYTCDRCEQPIQGQPTYQLMHGIRTDNAHGRSFDLCEPCHMDFLQWGKLAEASKRREQAEELLAKINRGERTLAQARRDAAALESRLRDLKQTEREQLSKLDRIQRDWEVVNRAIRNAKKAAKKKAAKKTGGRVAGPMLATGEVADRLSVTTHFLKSWRLRGEGPPWFQLPGTAGPAGIRYVEAELEAYIDTRTVNPSAKKTAKKAVKKAAKKRARAK